MWPKFLKSLKNTPHNNVPERKLVFKFLSFLEFIYFAILAGTQEFKLNAGSCLNAPLPAQSTVSTCYK